MTNWQMKKEITFRCPDCGHIQHETTGMSCNPISTRNAARGK